MNNIKLIDYFFFFNLTCDPELFPFFDAFPPSEPDDSFFESIEKKQREYFLQFSQDDFNTKAKIKRAKKKKGY